VMSVRDVERVATTLLYDAGRVSPAWHLGIVAPGDEMQAECLAFGDAATTFDVRVRFLQVTPNTVAREVSGATTFEWPPLSGAVDVSTLRYADRVIKLRVRVINTSSESGQSLIAPHAILRVSAGEFVSMIDPPPDLRHLARDCKNVRTCPVLAGERGQRQTMLASAVIVYDYPEIAGAFEPDE